jgi:hypothetical protein
MYSRLEVLHGLASDGASMDFEKRKKEMHK